MSSKSLDYYMRLPYKVEIFPDEDGQGFTAVIPELPGCMTASEDFAELDSLIRDAKRVWLEVALKHSDYIPEPLPEEVKEYSGKFLVRVPKSLHRQLSIRAEVEGTSLNQLIITIFANSMGRWSASVEQSFPTQAKVWVFDRRLAVSVSRDLADSVAHSFGQESYSWTTKGFTLPASKSEVIPL